MGDQIDVSYRGISVGSGLAVRDFGAATAFVEVEQPMPVGTRVDVTAGDVAFVARVVHVDEKAEGVEQPGMRIEGIELSEAAGAWWAERAPASGEPEAVTNEQPSDAARTAVMDAVDLEEIERLAKEEQAAEFEARQREAEQAMETKPDDDAGSSSNGRRKRRRKRKRKRR